MSGNGGNPIPDIAQMVHRANQPSGYQPPQQSEEGPNPLGMLQQYRANPFSLQTDMSRPEQFLPPALGNFDYGAQWRAQNAPKIAGMPAGSSVNPHATGGWQSPSEGEWRGQDAPPQVEGGWQPPSEGAK